MRAIRAATPAIKVAPACQAVGVSRATFYRRPEPEQHGVGRLVKPRPQPERALCAAEREGVLHTLNSEPFYDVAPRQVYAQLLDAGQYLCSVSTMYRILRAEGAVRERRDQLMHPVYARPELLATRPNEVWSWDITKLRGPQKWTYYYLYVIMDIYSRYVVGWMLAERESATLAQELIERTCQKQNILTGQLTIHADRGSSMKSGLVAQLLAELGVTKTHSRPAVSNDNPFSEAQFKTMKYRPEFPARFGSFAHAHTFSGEFFGWYNGEHRHTGIGLHTPENVHYGRAAEVDEVRRRALHTAYAQHPERFVRQAPEPPRVPAAVWINRPEESRAAKLN